MNAVYVAYFTFQSILYINCIIFKSRIFSVYFGGCFGQLSSFWSVCWQIRLCIQIWIHALRTKTPYKHDHTEPQVYAELFYISVSHAWNLKNTTPYLNLQFACEARCVRQGERTAESDEMRWCAWKSHCRVSVAHFDSRSQWTESKELGFEPWFYPDYSGVLPLGESDFGVFVSEAERAVHNIFNQAAKCL